MRRLRLMRGAVGWYVFLVAHRVRSSWHAFRGALITRGQLVSLVLRAFVP